MCSNRSTGGSGEQIRKVRPTSRARSRAINRAPRPAESMKLTPATSITTGSADGSSHTGSTAAGTVAAGVQVVTRVPDRLDLAHHEDAEPLTIPQPAGGA